MTKNPFAKNESKIKEESSTLTALFELYCRKKHRTREGLCEECASLRNYAIARLERCIFLPQKPTCARCPVHCYMPMRRQQIRQVMRFSAPRFYLSRPGLAVQHVWHTLQRPSKKVQEVADRLKTKPDVKHTSEATQTQMD